MDPTTAVYVLIAAAMLVVSAWSVQSYLRRVWPHRVPLIGKSAVRPTEHESILIIATSTGSVVAVWGMPNGSALLSVGWTCLVFLVLTIPQLLHNKAIRDEDRHMLEAQARALDSNRLYSEPPR